MPTSFLRTCSCWMTFFDYRNGLLNGTDLEDNDVVCWKKKGTLDKYSSSNNYTYKALANSSSWSWVARKLWATQYNFWINLFTILILLFGISNHCILLTTAIYVHQCGELCRNRYHGGLFNYVTFPTLGKIAYQFFTVWSHRFWFP